MNYTEFINHIKTRKFFNAYFLSGNEDYLLEEALNKLIQAVVEPATQDFNFDVYRGNEVDCGKILDTVNAYPMMAESRMVVVKEVHKIPVTGLELISKYLENPVKSTKLVLVGAKIDKQNKFITKIKSESCYVEFKTLYDRQIPSWIHGYLKEKGFEISQEAILLIQLRAGNNLRNIVNELDKVILNLNGNKTIDVQHVQEFTGLSRNYTVFELNDAIGHKDLDKSLDILNKMLENGESPTSIIAMLTRHFVNLLKLKGAIAQNKSRDEMRVLTGIHSFFITKNLEMTKNYSLEQFQHIFESLLSTDLILKTSQQSPQVALQILLIKMMLNK